MRWRCPMMGSLNGGEGSLLSSFSALDLGIAKCTAMRKRRRMRARDCGDACS
jgi:hypothetical protein